MPHKPKIRYVLWLFFGCFLAILLYAKIVPTGRISYSSHFDEKNYFIGKITPAERTRRIDKNIGVQIIGEPAYFTLRSPQKFKQAVLTLDYRINNEKIQNIQIGVLDDKTVWRYDLQPIYNRTIEDLAATWNPISENGLMLLQKEKKFDSIAQFQKALPDRKEIALFNFDLPENYKISNYQATSTKRIYPLALRGAFEFYTYIKNEPLDFEFEFRTLNKNKDEDDVEVNLYADDKNISAYQLKDTKKSVDNGNIEPLGNIKILKKDLPEGLYKIEVKANSDAEAGKITTTQSKISFLNKIWISDSIDRNKLVTDSPYLSVQTTNPGSLQEVVFGTEKIKLNETYKLITGKNISGVKNINFSKNDLLLAGNGVFAIDPAELINPSFQNLSSFSDPQREGIKYILANYALAKKIGDRYQSTATYDLQGAYQEKNKYSFIVSVPGLGSGLGEDKGLILENINIRLSGDDLWSKTKNRLKKIFKK